MIYNVRHRTTYSYEDVVTFARCVLRLTPQSSAAQTVLENAITITPQPSQTVERTGPFGEQMLTVMIDQPHRALIIEARSRVDVHAPPIESPADSPAWESVRARSFETAALGADSPAAYLYPTARTPILPAITDYARVSFPQGRPIIEAAADVDDPHALRTSPTTLRPLAFPRRRARHLRPVAASARTSPTS